MSVGVEILAGVLKPDGVEIRYFGKELHFSVFLFLVIPDGNRYNEKESLEGGDGKRCFN